MAAILGAFVACSSESGSKTSLDESALVHHAEGARDWEAHPAILEMDDADEIYAISDPHGGYVELGRLLGACGLVTAFSEDPEKAAHARWSGGEALLVITGDLVDKGADSVATIDLLRAVQLTSSGRVIVTMGNHEAEFLADPMNAKAMVPGSGVSSQLLARGVSPEQVARGEDVEGRGAWLRGLPFAARVKKWFFAHGGNTDGLSLAELGHRLERELDEKGYGGKALIGDDSILEAQGWYGGKDFDDGRRNAKRLGVEHIAFGHDPGALDDRGQIIARADGTLVKLNVNMGLAHESKATVGGLVLHVTTRGADRAEVLDGAGRRTKLF